MSILDLAYYPDERGPYNYTVNGLNYDGTLMNPQKNWAGIMRKIETNDFEAANIEFVEFWMMDPFDPLHGDMSHSGGDLYIQLGNVSEDVLKDGYKSFENGFPTSANIQNVDTTSWGRVPTNFSIVDAFDNDPVSRQFQDIGVAVSTERGLVVPIIKDADTKSLPEIEKSILEYSEKARDGKLSIEEMQGGTFTISNGGIFGSLLSTPILNAPQTAILGMHAIQERPVAINGEVMVRPMMYLAMSYDHRLLDGKEAVTFLVSIKEQLESPERLLLNL